MPRLRGVDFEDRLTLVEHLDELRTRLLLSLLVVVAVGIACFWQRDLILELANRPLPSGAEDFTPVTFSPTEPFLTTLTVVGYAAAIFASPFLLYQAYAFLVPALSDVERRRVTPVVLLVPVLFIAGVMFTYFAIAPIALEFLLNFGQENFQIELRAREYYSFLGVLMLLMGAVFQLPIGILALARVGVVTPAQLAANRAYALFGISVCAMLITPPDPVTMVLAIIPLGALYELSILLAKAFGAPREDDLDAPAATGLHRD